eukprot:6176441-Pleurochrysis_carterae.AAC.2
MSFVALACNLAAWHQQFRVNLKEDQHPGGMHDVSPAVLSGQELALPSVRHHRVAVTCASLIANVINSARHE